LGHQSFASRFGDARADGQVVSTRRGIVTMRISAIELEIPDVTHVLLMEDMLNVELADAVVVKEDVAFFKPLKNVQSRA
jgi:hypothetical protein